MENQKRDIGLIATIIILIIIIIVIGGYSLILLNQNKEESNKITNKVSQIENTLSNITTNTNPTNNTMTNTQANTTTKVSDIQKVTGAGYSAILYSDNTIEIKITDLTVILDEYKNLNDKTFTVTKTSGTISRIYAGNNGSGVDPVLVLIMEDGTVEKISVIKQILDSKGKITSFKSEGKISGLTNVISITKGINDTTQTDCMTAITEDGTQIDF